MTSAAALLDRLGRPGDVRLGTTRPATPRLPTGIAGLDAALGGGLPRGGVSELVGARSGGRTALACHIAATATAAGEIAAWIDPDDALDPETAAAAGIDLARLLWVRPRDVADALRAGELLVAAGGFGLVVLDLAGDGARAGRPPAAAAWSRLARAAERTRSTLLVLGTTRVVGTIAALGLAVTGRRTCWSDGPGRVTLLDGVVSRVAVVRSRSGGAGRELVVRQAHG